MMQTKTDQRQPLNADTIRAFVIEACGGDGEIVQQMVGFFLNSADKLVAEMRTGISETDFAVTRRAAHSLKSGSRMFSAERLSNLCYTAESMAVEERGADIRLLLPQIETELRVLKEELPAFCAGLVDES